MSEKELTQDDAINIDPAMEFSLSQAAALQQVRVEYGTLLVSLMGNPTREERDTWERQRDWAIRHNDGDVTASALLAGLLTQEERVALADAAPSVMAAKILEKNAGAEQLISLAGGIRRTAEKAVEAAQNIQEISAALGAAQAAAQAAIAQINAQ